MKTKMRTNKFSAMGLMVLVAVFSSQVLAFSSGHLHCAFEIYSKRQPLKAVITPAFTMDIMQAFEDSLESDLLENKILFRYTPGLVAAKDVKVFVLDMSYNMANAGTEVPFVQNGTYTVKIGRQDSDLIGAFLVCKAVGLK